LEGVRQPSAPVRRRRVLAERVADFRFVESQVAADAIAGDLLVAGEAVDVARGHADAFSEFLGA
jgi:hypothetical protein